MCNTQKAILRAPPESLVEGKGLRGPEKKQEKKYRVALGTLNEIIII